MSSFIRSKEKLSFKWNVKKISHAHFNLFYSHNKFLIYCQNKIESFTCVNGEVLLFFSLSFFSSVMYSVCCVYIYIQCILYILNLMHRFYFRSRNLFIFLSQNALCMSCLTHSTV